MAARTLWVLSLANAGCVTVYHPLSGLSAPVAIDPELRNFEGLSLLVHCVPKDFLDASDASMLCGRVEQLFINQGAEVRTVTSVSRTEEDEEVEAEADKKEDEEEEASPVEPPRVDLILELRARRLRKNTNSLLWVLSFSTFTLAPGVSDYSFVQEVTIRDERGLLLVTGELHGRFVRYFGLGVWAGNWLLDLIAREEDEELSEDNLKASISQDLYGQLSQMVFNARMRRQIMMLPGAAAGR